MDKFCEIIQNWNKKFGVIKEYKMDKNSLEIFYENVNFKFLIPTNNSDFITVDSDYEISWIDSLNIRIIEKNYNYETFDKILTIINNQIKKNMTEYIKKKISKIILDDMGIINNTEIEFLKMKQKILKLSESNTESTNTSDKKLFDKSIVLKIIGEEFLELYKKSQNSSKFSLELLDDNLSVWKVCLKNFTNSNLNNDLKEVKEKYGFDYIEINLKFNDELYPNYPLKLDFIKPKFKNSLIYKLSNLRILQLDYWSPVRSAEVIINKIHSILDKHCRIDIAKLYNVNSYSKLENALIVLGNHFEQIEDEMDDEKYEKVNQRTINDKKTNDKSYWKSGTGYGHKGNQEWDIDAYIKSKKEQSKELEKILNIIQTELNIVNDEHKEIINSSYLLKFINYKFEGNTLFEMEKHNSFYIKLLDIMQVLVNSYTKQIFGNEFVKFTKILEDLYGDITMSVKMGNQDDFAEKFIILKSQCDEIVKEYKQQISVTNVPVENASIENTYKTLEKYKFMEHPIIYEGSKFYFMKEYEANKGKKITYNKRMIQELGILRKSIPVEYGASVYVAMDPENISVLRVMITGPHDTPYDSGCFLFDVFMPETFPNTSPKVYMLNTGNVRFNPNLYQCGKVCLSILGTWSAEKGETWNKDTSSLLQVFMSILSLILIEQPYFNEPGYESYINTPKGQSDSEKYNNRIRYYTMQHAMNNLIKNNEYPQFTEVIKEHFKIKKDRILKECQKWVNSAPEKVTKEKYCDNNSLTQNDYQKAYDELKETLEGL
jgi:ubiquitin-protein ligase